MNTTQGHRRDDGNTFNRLPSKPTPKGHDAVLHAIQTSGRVIHVLKASGEERVGKLTGRDKYTITVQDESGTRRVIYKSQIEEFWTDEAAQKDA